MTIAYENVRYQAGVISKESNPPGWTTLYYDNVESPNKLGGKDRNLIFGSANRGASTFDVPGPARVYGRVGGPYSSNNPLVDIAMILAKNYVNQKGLGRQGPVGYNIAGGVLGALGSAGAGKYAEPPPSQDQPGILSLPGGVGINIFKGVNTSVDGSVRVNPAAVILPPRG